MISAEARDPATSSSTAEPHEQRRIQSRPAVAESARATSMSSSLHHRSFSGDGHQAVFGAESVFASASVGDDCVLDGEESLFPSGELDEIFAGEQLDLMALAFTRSSEFVVVVCTQNCLKVSVDPIELDGSQGKR